MAGRPELTSVRVDVWTWAIRLYPTRSAASAACRAGHVKVNGKRVNISSYSVKEGDVIELAEKSKQLAIVIAALDSKERDTPDYIEMDEAARKATFKRVPQLTDVPYPVKMEPNMVVEFYSR